MKTYCNNVRRKLHARAFHVLIFMFVMPSQRRWKSSTSLQPRWARNGNYCGMIGRAMVESWCAMWSTSQTDLLAPVGCWLGVVWIFSVDARPVPETRDLMVGFWVLFSRRRTYVRCRWWVRGRSLESQECLLRGLFGGHHHNEVSFHYGFFGVWNWCCVPAIAKDVDHWQRPVQSRILHQKCRDHACGPVPNTTPPCWQLLSCRSQQSWQRLWQAEATLTAHWSGLPAKSGGSSLSHDNVHVLVEFGASCVHRHNRVCHKESGWAVCRRT